MESLTDPIGLGVLGVGFGMVNVVKCQKKLIVMGIGLAAKLRSSICQDPQQRDPVLVKEGEV